ncbi:MAG: AAA family ATPase [Chloroflexota bacterium]
MVEQSSSPANGTTTGDAGVFIKRVVIENYKSIGYCDARLGPLTFLVGRNGSGKSNFLDALRFAGDVLRTNLDQAIRARGSNEDLRFRGAAPGTPISLRFELTLPHGQLGRYAFQLMPRTFGGYEVAEEECTIEYPVTGHPATGFHVRAGKLLGPNQGFLTAATDRLFLAVSAIPYVRPVYDVLTGMAFYQPVPSRMRAPMPHDEGHILAPDGSNCGSVLLRLAAQQPEALERIVQYLQAILPSLREVRGRAISDYDVLEFYQQDSPTDRPFPATSISDGTLHALAVLTALFQNGFAVERTLTVIGVEEPETALHPAATAVLRDAFREISGLSQVLVVTHSPDLLDDQNIVPESLLAVVQENGETRIGPPREGQQSIVRDHLATAGELLRTSNFRPTPASQSGLEIAERPR